MAAAIRNVRKSFVPPQGCDVQVGKIRSHSARHRCVNDMKAAGTSREVGKAFSRIATDKVYENYGKLNQQQVKEGLDRCQALQQTWDEMYRE